MPSRPNSRPPSSVPTMVAPMPQPASTDPTTSGLKPFWIRNGTAIRPSSPSGQR